MKNLRQRFSWRVAAVAVGILVISPAINKVIARNISTAIPHGDIAKIATVLPSIGARKIAEKSANKISVIRACGKISALDIFAAHSLIKAGVINDIPAIQGMDAEIVSQINRSIQADAKVASSAEPAIANLIAI